MLTYVELQWPQGPVGPVSKMTQEVISTFIPPAGPSAVQTIQREIFALYKGTSMNLIGKQGPFGCCQSQHLLLPVSHLHTQGEGVSERERNKTKNSKALQKQDTNRFFSDDRTIYLLNPQPLVTSSIWNVVTTTKELSMHSNFIFLTEQILTDNVAGSSQKHEILLHLQTSWLLYYRFTDAVRRYSRVRHKNCTTHRNSSGRGAGMR